MAKWTESQLDAIKASGGTVLVSAAAGSDGTSCGAPQADKSSIALNKKHTRYRLFFIRII